MKFLTPDLLMLDVRNDVFFNTKSHSVKRSGRKDSTR